MLDELQSAFFADSELMGNLPSIQPHKRSAARFAKKIEDPTFDRSQVMDPRDIAIQIEEEIRAGNKSSSVPTANPNASKSRSKASKASATTEVSHDHHFPEALPGTNTVSSIP